LFIKRLDFPRNRTTPDLRDEYMPGKEAPPARAKGAVREEALTPRGRNRMKRPKDS
jgi:hypothetical protein